MTMKPEAKEISKRLDIISELLKDLLILELSRAGFTRNGVRNILGKINNARVSRIAATLKKAKNHRK